MEEWSVYRHTSPSGKVYIGITQQKPEYRWRDGKGYKYNAHFYSAIKKYGWENFTHEVLFRGLTQEDAEDIEKRLVKEADSTNKLHGYNVAEGGHVLTEESRRKIGETRKARKIKPWSLGRHLSEETKEKISASRKGQKGTPWTEEQRAKGRAAKLGPNNPNYGKPMNPELKAKLIEMKKRPVVQITDAGEVKYSCAKEAGEKTGVASCNITRVCRGQRETAGGYRWMYGEA